MEAVETEKAAHTDGGRGKRRNNETLKLYPPAGTLPFCLEKLTFLT